MRYGSAFTGIGGFDLAFDRLGMTNTVQVEWDLSCQNVLRRHFPGANLKGNIADVTAPDLGTDLDLWVGGFPCQNTSIGAPHRAGLAGSRSGYFFDFTRLIEEYQRVLDVSRPEWVVIENPTGLLTSNDGRDLATVASVLGNLGYGWAYRVVDGRHLGSTFRRPRVLVVGRAGGDPRPAWAVLGDDESGGPAGAASAQRTHGTVGPAPALPDGISSVWRKSARPRAALSKGGWETWVADGNGNVLTGFDGGDAARQTHLVGHTDGRVRTLTYTEWERGLGFPDGWTDGVRANDRKVKGVLVEAGRHTVLGNTMQVGMADWLGRRLLAVDSNLTTIGA